MERKGEGLHSQALQIRPPIALPKVKRPRRCWWYAPSPCEVDVQRFDIRARHQSIMYLGQLIACTAIYNLLLPMTTLRSGAIESSGGEEGEAERGGKDDGRGTESETGAGKRIVSRDSRTGYLRTATFEFIDKYMEIDIEILPRCQLDEEEKGFLLLPNPILHDIDGTDARGA